jgi:hypothetical protein
MDVIDSLRSGDRVPGPIVVHWSWVDIHPAGGGYERPPGSSRVAACWTAAVAALRCPRRGRCFMQQRRRAARFAEQPDSTVNRVTVDKRACGWLGARAGELSSLVLQAAADSDLA